ncbi:hypothetical protein psyc5s11_51250 [Clostridium gelidum]|uniref:DUF2628 domain-containing protein n=1 Tax=Clostridium gelidum TaxID=704125 RepID=A0ABN6J6Q0_9CLOT|nr:DUF2628 domain-containing protein [Clostridium gelidum]BCZ49058.1 hypothetical protein psyc5s11_51250 [Clostridium gelidum]
MKCPHCQEELGLNDICINPACSYFGTKIEFSEKSHLNSTENNLDNKNSYNTEPNSYTSNTNLNNNNKFNNNPKFNNSNNNPNQNYDNINNPNNFQSLNKDNYTSDNISKEEFVAFIGSNNANYYLDYIDKMKKNTNFISWNWPCFFLGTYWLLYRKLYAAAAIFFVVTIGTSLLIPGVLSLLLRILLAMFANAIYLNHSVRQIKTVKTIIANLSATQYINRLHKKGGVNLAAPFILIAIYILIFIIIFAVYLSRTGIVPHNFSSPSYSY